ncbi:MAG: hypothetical protein JSU72_08830 [Deltaproteobacteria bacterium]|nr:MAG: hypothetical protein JSU72_08830 [Deltaproteobacteria bacterium]
MNSNRSSAGIVMRSAVILCVAALISCSGHTGRRAGEGAATGAMAGAVGGLVTGLVFGGDPAESAARGAAWGASTGAVAGAMSGARMDQAEKEKLDAELERLKADLGEDAFKGLEALADCKHEVALGYARTAAMSGNRNHALAGLWIEVLAYADRRQEDKARELFPDLVERDAGISSEAQAEETMRNALQTLMDIRGEYNLPRVCG